VIYNDSRAGYINNVPGTFTRQNSDFGIGYAGGSVPANSVVINNGPNVATAINPVVYQGLRLSVLAKFNEDWNLLIAQSFQHMDAKGVFYGDLNVYDQTDWMYRTLPACIASMNVGCLTDIGPPPGSSVNIRTSAAIQRRSSTIQSGAIPSLRYSVPSTTS
jgi:hypothetical protein